MRASWPSNPFGRLTTGAVMLVAAVIAGPVCAQSLIGQLRTFVTGEADTLVDLAVINDVGYVEIVAANPGVDPWLPGPGTTVVLPTAHLLPDAPHQGIVINLPDQRLYFFPQTGPPQTYPVGVPAPETDLRVGTTRIGAKREHPTWFPPPSVRAEDPDLPVAVPPGPDNPLGELALYTEWTNIVIHGTNRPYGIGRRVSHGCFRLYPEDIAALYRQVPVGTPVTVVDQPAKAGWVDGMLYLEVHPTLDQAYELESTGRFTPMPIPGLDVLVLEAAAPFAELLDWQTVDRVAHERSGLPTPILKIPPMPPEARAL